jgi:8-oxo-dGTP pyrophosphatase MutT (NUDIX family)
MDPEETAADTVVREFWEECGLEVTAGSWIVRAVDFTYSPNDRVYYEKRSSFVDAYCTERRGVAQEPDHELEWMTMDEALTSLAHRSFRWAVAQWMNRGT